MATVYRIGAAAKARLDPATVKSIQGMLGVPVTGDWDSHTDATFAKHQAQQGVAVDYGLDGNANNWEGLIASLQLRSQAPDNPAMQDPAYAAFLRQMGVESSNIRNEVQARTEQTQRQINRDAAGFEQQKSEKTQQIGLGYEDRGLYQSGARMQDQTKAAGDIDYARNQSEANQSDALAQYGRQANNQLAELGRKRAEEDINARTRISQKRAQQVYNPTQLAGS